MKVYQKLASLISAIENCKQNGNSDWHMRHSMALKKIVDVHMPSGAGFDCGTKLDLAASTPEKLVFTTDYHHMSEHGGYDGWTAHTITVRPSLALGFEISRISGRDRNETKDYIADTFHTSLSEEVAE